MIRFSITTTQKAIACNALIQRLKLVIKSSPCRYVFRKFPVLILFLLLIIGMAIIPACQPKGSSGQQLEGGKWYRGNTHTHATFSDVNDTNDVPTIARWYEDTGYNFLLLSEHNDHVANKKVFCHDEASDPPNFIMLCGLELSNNRHHTALGIDRYIGDETSLQDGVNKITAAGGVAILNHPQDPVETAAAFIATKGLNHLEIVNGGRPEDTPATEMLWDSVLSAPDGRIVYAVASDDNHYKKSNVGKGWIMVNSPALAKKDIVDNIRSGNFYATTGIKLNDYKVSKTSITIDSENGSSITFIGKNGSVLKSVNDKKATYNMQGSELYVRAKITNTDGKAAWTQPVFMK